MSIMKLIVLIPIAIIGPTSAFAQSVDRASNSSDGKLYALGDDRGPDLARASAVGNSAFSRPTWRREESLTGLGIAVKNEPAGDGQVDIDTVALLPEPWSPRRVPSPGTLAPLLDGQWTALAIQWGVAPIHFRALAGGMYGLLPAAPIPSADAQGNGVGFLRAAPFGGRDGSADDRWRTHLVRERVGKVRDHDHRNRSFLHQDDDPEIASRYRWLVLAAFDNGTSLPQPVEASPTRDQGFSYGFQKVVNPKGGIPVGKQEEMALDMIFGHTVVAGTLASFKMPQGHSRRFVVPAHARLTWAICYTGRASDYRVSKWGEGGFLGDGRVTVVENVVPKEVVVRSPVGVPWNGETPE